MLKPGKIIIAIIIIINLFLIITFIHHKGSKVTLKKEKKHTHTHMNTFNTSALKLVSQKKMMKKSDHIMCLVRETAHGGTFHN